MSRATPMLSPFRRLCFADRLSGSLSILLQSELETTDLQKKFIISIFESFTFVISGVYSRKAFQDLSDDYSLYWLFFHLEVTCIIWNTQSAGSLKTINFNISPIIH